MPIKGSVFLEPLAGVWGVRGNICTHTFSIVGVQRCFVHKVNHGLKRGIHDCIPGLDMWRQVFSNQSPVSLLPKRKWAHTCVCLYPCWIGLILCKTLVDKLLCSKVTTCESDKDTYHEKHWDDCQHVHFACSFPGTPLTFRKYDYSSFLNPPSRPSGFSYIRNLVGWRKLIPF